MKIVDYSPVASPSLEEQRVALQKGLGRAMQWAMAGKLDDGPLLEACLHDKRHDSQIDSTRSDWLWQIIQAVRAKDRFRSSIYESLRILEEDDAEQLCGLGFHYATNGDDAFRSRLYEIVETKPISCMPSLGEKQIVQLDGEKALLIIVGIRGILLQQLDWEWCLDDDYYLDEYIELLGEERVYKALEAATDEVVKRYWNIWVEKKREAKQNAQPLNAGRMKHEEQMKQITVDDILSASESDSRQHMFFGSWGKWADENDLERVHQRLLKPHDSRIIANFLSVFSKREYHPVIPELISFCHDEDEKVCRRAFTALQNNSHPLVRQFAEMELQKGVRDENVLGLFVKNYRLGDEMKILDAIVLPDYDDGDNRLHWLIWDVLNILDNNPQADSSQIGLMAYAQTPCGSCRHRAARLLHNQKVAPTWLTEECRFDADTDSRTLAAQQSQIELHN